MYPTELNFKSRAKIRPFLDKPPLKKFTPKILIKETSKGCKRRLKMTLEKKSEMYEGLKKLLRRDSDGYTTSHPLLGTRAWARTPEP